MYDPGCQILWVFQLSCVFCSLTLNNTLLLLLLLLPRQEIGALIICHNIYQLLYVPSYGLAEVYFHWARFLK